jgi:hypothetical protein
MSDRITRSDPLIEPIYLQSNPSEAIDLGQHAIRLTCNGKTYEDLASVVVRFLPRERIEIVCPWEGKPPLLGVDLFSNNADTIKLTLEDKGTSFDVFCASFGGTHGGIVFLPKRSGVTVTPRSNSISLVTLHLFNFPDFLGPEDYTLTTNEEVSQAFRRCGRVLLRAGGWTVTIAATDRTKELTDALKAQGGYVLTHMVQVTRDDKAMFSSEQVSEFLNCLHYFLSFALGRWAGIALPVGFDPDGKRVFEEWGFRITADGPWRGGTSWFDEHHSELLPQVFPGFINLWMNKLWQKAVSDALYWYLGACDRRVGIGVDAGLILAQTALELLAWTYCVRDRKMVSEVAFQRRLSAADKFRLLAASLSIPLEIPTNLSALHGRPGKKWVDAMDAITTIRNSLIHPSAHEHLLEFAYFEAWKLSLWYIDLVVLRLCNHSGKYANRLHQRWTGQIESVPWAQNSN